MKPVHGLWYWLAMKEWSKTLQWQELAMFRLSYGVHEKRMTRYMKRNRKSKRNV